MDQAPSMLDLTPAARESIDLIVLAHTEDVGGVAFTLTIVGYTGGRFGTMVFEDAINYAIEIPGDEVSDAALLELAGASVRDAGIDFQNPEWVTEMSGFEHHAQVRPRAIQSGE